MTAAEKLQKYLNGDKLNVRYTLQTDDITCGEAPFGMPYRDRKGYFDASGYCKEARAQLTVSEYNGGLKIELATSAENLSEFGLSFPFNFMGKKNGGGWSNQYLLNSPYSSVGNDFKYCYLTNPNGKNLIVFPKGHCDGWKCDYSSEFCPGHFFLELEFLANFDKAYKTESHSRRLDLYLFEADCFESAIDAVCRTLGVPALTYEKSFAKAGQKFILRVHGLCDEVRCGGQIYTPRGGTVQVPAVGYGLVSAVPYYKGVRGMEAVFFVYDDIAACYKRAMDSVSEDDLQYTDENLCEHQCWESAMLRYMLRYGQREEYLQKLKPALAIILEQDEKKALPRRTIFDKGHKNAPPYSIFESNRIQEQLFGVTILTDAYRLTGEEKYFRYLTGALDCVLQHHFDHGMIYTDFLNGGREDYTTVCCLIIPFIDAALVLAEDHPSYAEKYRRAAGEIADYLYHRKEFHTEAYVSEETEPEMEDGSISCTALSLLYYAAKIERREEYIARAKEILDLHEPWVTHTPISPCFHSSLRWWETFWEGDATGPSICFGHAWTIWRAEADYWYWFLTKDERYRLKALNGFMSNFSKAEKDGKMYACYNLDYIPGGGFATDCKKTVLKIRQGKPKRADSGLSRYVWVRASETVLTTDWL